MMKSTRTIALAGIAVIATAITAMGCGSSVGKLKTAASDDFKCPKSQVRILNSGSIRRVEACGNRATYKWEGGEWNMLARQWISHPSELSAPQAQPVGGQPVPQAQPVVKTAPAVAPAQPAPTMVPTGTPSMPPSTPPPPSSPPPSPAPGQKAL